MLSFFEKENFTLSYNGDIAVTVHCIVYNHEKYLRDALDGFIMQKTNFKFEVLVHDDASTDSSPDIIREYELKYPDIIKPIYQKENLYSRGISRTYKYMVPNTRGKYVAFCEGDDYWTDPYKLQKQYDYMEQHPECSLVAHDAMVLNCDTGTTERFTRHDFSKPENCDFSSDNILDLPFTTAAMFYKKDFYIRNEEFLKTIRCWDYVLKVLLATEGTVHVIPECMSVYRRRAANSWSINVARNTEKYFRHQVQAAEFLEKINTYKEYKYDAVISEYCTKKIYMACSRFVEISGKAGFKQLKEEPYFSYYKKLSFKKKRNLYIRAYLPFLYKLRKH